MVALPVLDGNHYVFMTLTVCVPFDTHNSNPVLEPTCICSSPVVCVPQTVRVATQFPCVYELLRSTPVYDSHCYIVIAKNSCPG